MECIVSHCKPTFVAWAQTFVVAFDKAVQYPRDVGALTLIGIGIIRWMSARRKTNIFVQVVRWYFDLYKHWESYAGCLQLKTKKYLVARYILRGAYCYPLNVCMRKTNVAIPERDCHFYLDKLIYIYEYLWWRHQMEKFSALRVPVPVKSPHNSQWRGALMFSLICAWISGWVNNLKAGDLRRHRAHHDVTVMTVRK